MPAHPGAPSTIVFMPSHCLPTPSQETPKHTQASLAQSPVGHCSFLPDPGVHKVLFVTPRVCFPSPVEFLQSNLTSLQNEIPWGFSDHLLGSQAWKSIVDHRTITRESIPKSDLLYSLRPKMEKLNK